MGRKNKQEIQGEKEIAKHGKNYAGNTAIADRAYAYVIDDVRSAKNNRKAKESEWLEDLRLWSSYLSDSQMYRGRSNLFLPELQNQVESSVSKFQQGLFPNDDYVTCIPLKGTNDEDAEKIKEAVFYELDYKNNLPEINERFERQKILYGTAFYKGFWLEQKSTTFAKNKKGGVEIREVPEFEGVKWKVCDSFRTYVYPEQVEDLSDASLIFEEDFVEKRYLESSGLYANLDDISEINGNFVDFSWVDTIRMEIANISTAASNRPKAVHICEIWCEFDIVPGKFEPCVITLGNFSRVLRVQKNPFWHQKSPFLMGRYVKGPAGELYGRSLAERIRSMQYMMNDLANQTMDSLTYALNPICLIDPGYAGDVNSFKLQPGAKWFASPQGVQFQSFPDVSVSGFQGMQQIRGLIQQFSDLAPDVAPQLSGKVRSATQAQAVSSEISSNLRNMIRSDEYDVLAPMCKMTHIMLQQFSTESRQILIQGPEKGQWIRKDVRPEDLVGDVEFIWRGMEAAQKNAVKDQQLLSFFNMAVNMAALMPGEVDLPNLYKLVAKRTFDLELSDVFKKDKESKTVDPELENIALNQGQDVDVNMGDVFEQHMPEHDKGLAESQENTDLSKAEKRDALLAYLRHKEKHELQKQAKDMLQQQMAQMAALQAQGALPGQQQGPGGPPQGGNRSQAPSSVGNMLQGIRGVEPNG